MEHGQQEVQPSITLGQTWSKLQEDMSQGDRLQRPYGNHQRLTRNRPNQLSSGFTPFRNQTISGQESVFIKTPGSFQEKTRMKGQKQDLFQPKAGRVRPNDPAPVVLGQRSIQELKIVVHNARISSDALWLQMAQYAVKTQKQFLELHKSHDRMKKLTASMEKIVKALQEVHAQLSKPYEEINQRPNQVFEEHHHCKRDMDFLYQDSNKLFNVYQIMKPQPQGHVLDNPYHQEDIKSDAFLDNKERTPSQYEDRENMSYSEKEELKQLPERSSWPKLSGTGEYDHMELIDVPSCHNDVFQTSAKGTLAEKPIKPV
ncbi:hypothetical protein O181_013298 [Austropuccinia psidii MF-1]|uniref:Uncharacterized protein n=1 Tax=Austropuccinia psidii MF-1 TaxID=1389203 RepID=A0A9Q3BYF1_9BASI|nr:hypothetical protein [Austropuccinia psidii MF-1]